MYYKYIIFGNSPHKVKSLWLICILETDGPFGSGKGPRGFKHLDAAIWIACKPEEQTHCPKQFALSKKISAFFLKCNVIRHLISGYIWYFPMEWTLKVLKFDEFCWLHHLNPPLNFWPPLKLSSPPGYSRATKTWWAILEADGSTWWGFRWGPGSQRLYDVTCIIHLHLSLCIIMYHGQLHIWIKPCHVMSIHVPGDSWSSCFCAFVDALKWSMALHMPGNSRKRPTSDEKNLKHLMT